LDYHIHFIQGTDGYSGGDYTDNNVLWLQIVSGTGTNTSCVANLSWKTNAPASNPNQHTIALQITNAVLAGTWTVTFLSDTNGTLTAPGAAAVPFSLVLDDADAIADFSSPMQIRFGIQNNGNTANGGIPHDWAKISISGTAGTQINEDFTKEGTNQLDTTIWDLGHSDGVGVVNLVSTNSPYWIKWTLPDTGFSLIGGNSLLGRTNWNNVASTAIAQGGARWALVPGASLPAGPANYFSLVQRTFTKLQVLLPGETNAPNTATGKVGTPTPISYADTGGAVNVTINAVDSTYHIVTTAPGNLIGVTSSDVNASIPPPANLVNGTLTEQLFFSTTGSFTLTATNMTATMPSATSSSITVNP